MASGLIARECLIRVVLFASLAFASSAFASYFHENPSHRFGGRGEEVATAVPMLRGFDIHQPQVSFVDQGCSLQGLPRSFLGQLLGREFAQFVVDQRQELLGGVRVAFLDGGQDARNFTHGAPEVRKYLQMTWSIASRGGHC